ncbi:hypothetical protein [Aeromicrobium sp.]|uniref:hypothetical protein n=1 Tax=Aeromicrobium sp. TaxID=1871063 RepID=UPI0028A5C034|nr:hypothetical protein [Aeromicrobium sp.]
MIRVYAPATIEHLRELADDRPVELEALIAVSDDEEDEYDALLVAAEQGALVITAEVETADAAIRPQDVRAFHLDADGSGDLAWYAPQELDQVIALLAV